ncbi:MAG: transport protein TonB [Massilibacillus sp.]|jgi:TonB family protein|nr:transport protein TonB [Massilibacillus sp.]
MLERLRWQKASCISFLVHGVFLLFIFYMTNFVFSDQKSEEYTEVVLVKDEQELEHPVAKSELEKQMSDTSNIKQQNQQAQSNEIESSPQTADGSAKAAAIIGGDIAIGAVGTGSGKSLISGNNGSGNNGGGKASSNGTAAEVDQSSPAKRITATKPSYPERDRRQNREGTVSLGFTVLADGEVSNIEILSSDCSETMNQAAIHCVEEWKYTPARDSTGQAIAYYKKAKVTFDLENQ